MNKYPTFHKGGYDCDKSLFPELPSIVTDVNNIDRIISIGDIHGDLDLALEYLLIPNLIERVYESGPFTVGMWYKDESIKRYYKWIGTRTIVVQVGDQVDRCRPYKDSNCMNEKTTVNDEASDVTILFFYHDLHLVALECGCALYSLLGNHEILNVVGNMNYVSYKGLVEFPTEEPDIRVGRIETFAKKSDNKLYKGKASMSEFFACGRLTSIIVAGYLFIHAGIMEQLVDIVSKKDKLNIIPTINKTIKDWLLEAYDETDKEFMNTLIEGQTESPFWPRIFGQLETNLTLESEECQKYVQPVLNALNIKGIIVGHTPQYKININSTCSNTVWRVDIASSQAFDKVLFNGRKSKAEKQRIQQGRRPQVLEITLGKNGSPDSFVVLH